MPIPTSAARLLRNAFSNYALTAVTALTAFILTPILYRDLKPVNFAVLTFSMVLVAVVGLLDLGLAGTLIRYVSELAARGLLSELWSLASTVFFLLLALGAGGSLVMIAARSWIAAFFHIHASSIGDGPRVIALVALTLTFELPAGALRGVLEGFQDFHLANAVDIASHLVRAALILLFLWAGWGLVAVAALYPLWGLLRLLGLLAVVQWSRKGFLPHPRMVEIAGLKRIRTFASLALIEDTATSIFFQVDNFLAAKLLSLPELALLVVARRFPTALWGLVRQTITVTYPVVSTAAAHEDHPALTRFMVLASRILLAMLFALATPLFVWSGVILRLWVGPEVVSGTHVFQIFLVFAFFAGLQEVPLMLFYGTGKILFSAILSVLLLAGTVIFGAWASGISGLIGLAVVFASLQGITTVLLLWRSLKTVGLSFHRWLRRSVLPPVLAELPAFCVLLFSYRWFPHTWAGLALSFTTTLALYCWTFQALFVGSEGKTARARFRRMFMEVD
jgi:O-antigen/teichoic acid export membrane protein